MAVRVKCSKCGKTVKGGDDWGGKRGKCPKCGGFITFPPAASPLEVEQESEPVEKIAIDTTKQGHAKKKPGWLSPLTTCKDCGGTVSRSAKACPHCGSKSFDTAHAIGEIGNGLIGCGCLLILLPALLVILLGVFGALG